MLPRIRPKPGVIAGPILLRISMNTQVVNAPAPTISN